MAFNMSKIISIVLYVLLGISALLGILFYIKAIDAELFLIWTYILVCIAAVAAIVFPVILLIKNPKNTKKSLIGIIAVVVIIGIAYFIASDEILTLPGYTGLDNVPSMLKFAGTSLFSMYILAIAAVASIFYVEIAKYFKK